MSKVALATKDIAHKSDTDMIPIRILTEVQRFLLNKLLELEISKDSERSDDEA
jgi:hypothetical protein